MNINWIHLKSVVQELKNIRYELNRLADCWESELAERGLHMRPPKADMTGPEPSLEYTDEAMDAVHEMMRKQKQYEELDHE